MKRNVKLSMVALLIVLPVYSMDVALLDLARELQNLADVLSGNVPPPLPPRQPVVTPPGSTPDAGTTTGASTGGATPTTTPATTTPGIPTAGGGIQLPSGQVDAALKARAADLRAKAVRTTREPKTGTLPTSIQGKAIPTTPIMLVAKINPLLSTYYITPKTGKVTFAKAADDKTRHNNAEKALKDVVAYMIKNKENLGGSQQQPIAEILELIAYNNPVLIADVADQLEALGYDKQAIYNFVIDLFEYRVRYVENLFALYYDRLAKSAAVGPEEAMIDDLEEGMVYFNKLQALLDDAAIEVDLNDNADSKTFIADANLRIKRLQDLFLFVKQNKDELDKFKKAGSPVEDYIQMLEAPQMLWCITAQTPGGSRYITLRNHFDIILSMINEYKNNTSLKESQRLARLQSIANRINGFVEHASSTQYCTICLDNDIKELKAQKNQNKFDYVDAINTIKQFLTGVNTTHPSARITTMINETLPKLQNLIVKGCGSSY